MFLVTIQGKDFIPAAEMRRAYGIGRVTEWRWRKQGLLKGTRIGNMWFYPYPEVENMVKRARALKKLKMMHSRGRLF